MPFHVYLDLDGTLTDPYEGITRCILYALEKMGAPLPDEERLRGFIGPPLQVTFREFFDDAGAHRALQLYRERFDEVGWQENLLYPGIPEALEALKSQGHTLFVATTKPWGAARRIVKHFGIAEYLDHVFGSELDGTRVDKSELLAWALPQNSAGQHAIMVGDRKHDILGGLNNNMQVLGVSYGYGSQEELTTAGAAHIIDTPGELPGAIGR